MKKRMLRAAGICLALLTIAGLVIPYVSADRYGHRLQAALERALGRQVEIGRVRFSLFKGPGFTVERDESGPGVVIHEDPALGIEPIAYVETMEVRPSLWALLTGKFRVASIRLEDASINLAKSGAGGLAPAAGRQPAAQNPGRWNFTSFIDRSVMGSVPAIHVRNGRINFKFGDTKSVFYLTGTNLDIVPPGSLGKGWTVSCSGQPARTDRSGRGLGAFAVVGHWFLAPERVDLHLTLDRSWLGEWTALLNGEPGAVQGIVTARLHLGGPISNIGLAGRLTVNDVHRWDLMPSSARDWPLDIRGRLDLIGQRLELESNSAGKGLPLSVRLRASDYLTQPNWAVAVNWNRFPLAPLMEMAAHMGFPLPPQLKFTGTMDGAVVYSREGRLQGELGFHDAAVAAPEGPPLRFGDAYMVLGQGHARLSPAMVHTAADEQAEVAADYALDRNILDLSIHSDGMSVASLREGPPLLAAVPWLEQVKSGEWSGDLHHHREAGKATWTGRLEIRGAEVPVPGMAHPVELAQARVQIDDARVVLDRMQARIGKLSFGGEYRYEPALARPHRVRLRVASLDAADLEAEMLPTLRRNRGLLARALGRSSVPDWMKGRAAEGTLQIDELLLDGWRLAKVRGQLRWDGARLEVDGLQANLDRAVISGRLAVGLRSAEPSYRLTGQVKGLSWQSGKVDAEGTLETTGTGAQLLANLKSAATFTASTLDFGAAPPWRGVSGSCNLAWSPRLLVTDLNVKTAEDETYTGRGAAQQDGRLVILLTNGAREMRLAGTLAKLKLEETKP